MAELILLRHGQSVANAEMRFTRGPDEPLTEQGRGEAHTAGERLKGRVEPVALYASPFSRAVETARIVGAHFGLEPAIVDAFREQFFGDLQGLPYSELARVGDLGGAGRWQMRPPGGETLEEVARRVGPALDDIARRHLSQQVIVVSHGAVMAAVQGHVRSDFSSPPTFATNAAGYRLEWDDAGYRGPFELG